MQNFSLHGRFLLYDKICHARLDKLAVFVMLMCELSLPKFKMLALVFKNVSVRLKSGNATATGMSFVIFHKRIAKPSKDGGGVQEERFNNIIGGYNYVIY